MVVAVIICKVVTPEEVGYLEEGGCRATVKSGGSGGNVGRSYRRVVTTGTVWKLFILKERGCCKNDETPKGG